MVLKYAHVVFWTEKIGNWAIYGTHCFTFSLFKVTFYNKSYSLDDMGKITNLITKFSFMFHYKGCYNPISLAQDEDEHSRSGTLQSKMMGGRLVQPHLRWGVVNIRCCSHLFTMDSTLFLPPLFTWALYLSPLYSITSSSFFCFLSYKYYVMRSH